MNKKIIFFVVAFILSIGTFCHAQTAEPRKPDPSGIKTGTAGDISAAKPGEPTLNEVAEQVGKNKISINLLCRPDLHLSKRALLELKMLHIQWQ